MSVLKRALTALCTVTALCTAAPALSEDQGPIKVGILHSMTGTMAMSEAPLKDVILMLIDEQNRKGGLLGRRLEAVVMDPGSSWPRFSLMAEQMITDDKVDVIFGCWTSGSRKAVLPVVEKYNSLLFYPVQFEGEESSRNIIYTGAAPNQQALPGVDYLYYRRNIKRWVLIGSDYIYPRVTNELLIRHLRQLGVNEDDIKVMYMPLGFSEWGPVLRDIQNFTSDGEPAAIVSTINGDSNISFYIECAQRGITAADLPIMTFSLDENEIVGVYTKPFVGHLASMNYFQSVATRENQEFIKRWRQYRNDEEAVTSNAIESSYLGFKLWVQAAESAGSVRTDDILGVVVGQSVTNLSGSTSTVLPNHLLSKPLYMGEMTESGQFRLLWSSSGVEDGQAYSPIFSGREDVDADWRPEINCPRYDKTAQKCLSSSSHPAPEIPLR